MHPLAEKYLRKSSLPTLFCPGCGHGTVLNCFIRAIDELGIIDDVGLVSGIGCLAGCRCLSTPTSCTRCMAAP